MASEKLIESARRNGALSNGPVTTAGKARNSRNAIRHGLLANCLVLDNESRSHFRRAMADVIACFEPADNVELAIVEEMGAALWRLRRAWVIETASMNTEIHKQTMESELTRIATAFRNLSNSGAELSLLPRYESRLSRMFQRGMRNLCALRNVKFPNEPNLE